MVDRSMSRAPGRRCAAFTFIEALCCLLVVSLGVASAVGLTYYALLMGSRAEGKATGMATAMTVAIDPQPLMHASSGAHWQSPGPIGTTTGWINGLYVVRVETPGPQIGSQFSNNAISVDVYDGIRGHLITSYTTWVMRQPFSP